MAISMNWVGDYVSVKDVDLKELALKITKAGVNVEAVHEKKIANLVIGYVEKRDDHPNSDHLNVCSVNVGNETTQIVCGASNVREGIKVIVALPGAILPGDFEIKKSKIRGVESNGMICALFELGLEEKTEENYAKGIHELPSDAPVGEDPIRYLGLDDTVYELDLNPNRSMDCTNHVGFAYEVASILGRKVEMPSIETSPIDDSIKKHFSLKVDTDKCSMYHAKMVKDVVIKESPDFIKNRLVAAGMRPINNVVDISNYIMLEYGQPLHFFDKDKLGDKIVVRMAKENETIMTLDNKERILCEDDIVITDGDKPVCIAGVMGGKNTDVDDSTKNILIESAIFHPYHVRYTSLRLDLRSEASLRYEKGLNYEYTQLAIERACHLLEKYADGKVLQDTLVHDNVVKNVKKVEVTLEEINKLLGMTLTDKDVQTSLTNLGFEYVAKKNTYQVTIPNRRLDIETNKADIIEEVGRLYGYDNIVSTLPVGVTRQGRYIGNVSFRKLISKRLRALGLNEAKTYTLVSEEENDLFKYNRQNSIELLRPLSSDKKIIRQTLLPSLLKAVEYNKSRNVKDIFLYEIANVYSNIDEEETKVAAVIMGNSLCNQWNGTRIKADFYLLKGIIENLFDYLGLKNRYTFKTTTVDSMHPGICASILIDREEVGFIGKVHPSVSREDLYVFEFSMNKVVAKKTKAIKYKEPPKYPSMVKDLAFVLKKSISAEEVMTVIKKACGRLLVDIDVFDYYVGETIDSDCKSLAFKLTFMDSARTLSEEEVMNLFNKAIQEVTKVYQATLRDK